MKKNTMKHLETKQTEIKSRIDRVIRLQYDVGSDEVAVFFNISARVEGEEEEFGEYFDSVSPINIPILDIKDELDSILKRALEIRGLQIEGKTQIKQQPDYKTFFNTLLVLPIFQLAQSQNREDLALNAAYTDFSIILSNAISGAENIPALQASFDAVLEGLVFEDRDREEYLEPLRDTIQRNNIPLKIN